MLENIILIKQQKNENMLSFLSFYIFYYHTLNRLDRGVDITRVTVFSSCQNIGKKLIILIK